MGAVFLKLFNMAVSASWLILAVLAVRLFFKRAPKWVICLMWGLVAVRLICPFSVESKMSLLPSGETIPQNIAMERKPQIESGLKVIDEAVNPVIEYNFSPQISDSVNPLQVIQFVSGIIWILGVAGMLVYMLICFILLKRKVRASVGISEGVRECDEVGTPFILGVIRPVIYVPSGMDGKTLELVTAHEKAHIARGDHWWKPFGFALLSVYWFNPLCWLAYILLCKDIEAACDEKVIRDKTEDYKAAYSQALLDLNTRGRLVAACPLAFGENSVKGRIKGVLNYKKPAIWVMAIAMVVCGIVAVCFLTDPMTKTESESELTADENDVVSGNINVVAVQCPIEGSSVYPAMIMTPDYSVGTLRGLDEETAERMYKELSGKQWELVETDTSESDAEAFSLYIYNDGQPFRLTFYDDNTVDCEHDKDIKRYKVDTDKARMLEGLTDKKKSEAEGTYHVYLEPKTISNEGVWEQTVVNVSSDTDTGVPYAIGPNETRVIAYVTDEDPEFNVYTRPVSGGPVRITMIDGDASETAEFPVQSSDQAVYFYPSEDETKPGTVVIVKGTAGPSGSAGTLHITGD